MSQKFITLSAVMTLGIATTLFSLCDGMAVPQNKTEELTHSNNNTVASNTTSLPTPHHKIPVLFEGDEVTQTGNVAPPKNNTSGTGSRVEKQYYSPYPVGLGYSPFGYTYSSAVADGLYNPFPNYYPARLGGITGPGNTASSCAYAYPNRRYACLGLGRRK